MAPKCHSFFRTMLLYAAVVGGKNSLNSFGKMSLHFWWRVLYLVLYWLSSKAISQWVIRWPKCAISDPISNLILNPISKPISKPISNLISNPISNPISNSISNPILNRSVASPSDNLISLSYSMPVFSANLFGLFF